MSEDSDYEQFVETVRADHAARAMPPAAAKRIEAGVGAHVSWRHRLPADVAAGLAGLAAARASRAVASAKGLTTRGYWTKVAAALVPVIGLAAVSYSVTNTPAPAPARPTAFTVEPAPVPPPVVAEPSGSAAALPALAGPGDLPDAKDPPSAPIEHQSKAKSSHAKRAGDGTYEAELALLTQVTSALQEKQPSRALTLIDEHDRRFPNGALAPEFAGERVLTLAALGRHTEACAQSAKFLAKYPKSPFVPEVRSSCVDSTSNQ